MEYFKRITVPIPSKSEEENAVARMRSAPQFLSKTEWDILSAYQGPVVSGNPEGVAPNYLDDDR